MNETIQDFIALAYLAQKIERFSKGIINNIENDRSTMPTDIFNIYQKIIIRFFDPITLKEAIKKTITKHYDEHKMQQMLHFMQQPNMVHITKKEEVAKSLQASQEMQNFFTELQTTPPSEQRKHLIESIDKAIGSSALVVDMQVTLFQAITWGLRNANPNTQDITKEQLQQMALEMKAQMRQQVPQQIWMSMLFAYKEVSDETLQDYLTLNQSTEGQLTATFIRTVYSDMYQNTTKQLQYALEAAFTQPQTHP